MPELRWTLLILGALFISGLALWEWRRQRLARGSSNVSGAFGNTGAREGERLSPTFDGPLGGREGERISPTFEGGGEVHFDSAQSSGRGVFREPTLTFPDVALEVPNDARDRFADPPVVELDDDSLDQLKVEAGEAVDEFSEPAEAGEAVDNFSENIDEVPPAEPMVPKLSAAAVTPPTLAPAGQRMSGERFGAENGNGARAAFDEHDEPTTRFEVSAAEQDVEPYVAPASEPAAASAMPLSVDSLEPVEPVVDWPDEDVRKIVALRLVSGAGERFAGRAVRLALAAEGFVLGKFDIFHKPGPDARAVLSAASLTKPGTFTLGTMDAQRYGGISLFAVLPGPLSPLATFDELLTTAKALNDRLRGALQDERGEPLTPMRSASIRESLTAAATAAAPVVGAAAAPPVVGSPSNASPA